MRGGALISSALSLLGGANLITFLIDESGHIAHAIDKPACANHTEEAVS